MESEENSDSILTKNANIGYNVVAFRKKDFNRKFI